MNDFNPFQFQYPVKFLQEDGEEAILKIMKGATEQIARVPRNLLPENYEPGQKFSIKIEESASAKQTELETMKRLLEELIN